MAATPAPPPGSWLQAIRGAIGPDEALLFVGLALGTVGLWAWAGAAALMAPGVCLVWIAMPGRTPLVIRPADPREAPRRAVTVRPPQHSDGT